MSTIGGQQEQKQGVENAKLDYRDAADALGQKSAEVNAQFSEDAVTRAIEGAKSQGRIAASISDGGFGKGTIAAVSQQQAFESGRATSLAQKNLALEQLQIRREGNAAFGRMKNVATATTTNPLALMGLAGAGLAATGIGASK